MESTSLRINASSSPRGSVEHANPGKTKAACSPTGTKMTKTTSKPPRGQSRFKFRNVSREVSKKQPNYIHVHHYKLTNLYGAWFNDPSSAGKKKRLFFGSHLTAYLAARAQDRAALKYKPSALDPSSIKLNFREEDYAADKELRKILTNDEFGELLRKESRPKYTKMEPTPCLRKFLEEEAAEGNIPIQTPTDNKRILSLKQYLQDVVQKRNMGPGLLPVVESPTADNDRSDDGSEYEEPDEESEDEVEVPVDCNEARNANSAVLPEMARIAVTQPASPVQTESTRRFPLRSGSNLTSPIPSRIEQEEPPVLKWGAKRRRSNLTRPSLAPWSNAATKLFSAPRTETEFKIVTKIHYKIHKMNTKSKTREACATTTTTIMASAGGVDLPVSTETTNLDLLASTAVAQLMLEAPRVSAFHRYVKPSEFDMST